MPSTVSSSAHRTLSLAFRQLCWAAAVSMYALGFGSVHAAIGDHKTTCTAVELTAIDAAKASASAELSAAIARLDAPDSTTIKKFIRWFGSASSESTAEVASRLSRMLLFSGFQNVWCVRPSSKPVPDEFDWGPNDLAGVHQSSNTDMFFAPGFFELPDTGKDSKASTVYHESAHQVGADFQPEVYTVQEVESLAVRDGASARRHAQSIEYFVTDLLHGI